MSDRQNTASATSTQKAAEVRPYGRFGKKEEVAEMFNNIAHRYDFLNHTLSMGIDRGWRKKAIRKMAAVNPERILDVATGTADLALEALSLQPEKVIGVDISEAMLAKGREKVADRNLSDVVELRYGDSEALEFEDNSFDAAMVAYGVRNFENLGKGLSEINRVLRPGGILVVLEFSRPRKFPIRPLYDTYFRVILPRIGRLVSKDTRAYSYLYESVSVFPDGEAFEQELTKAGFQSTTCERLSFGITSIYTGIA